MVNSDDKGKRGEREAAAFLRTYGFEARRGQQFSGGGDSPDIVTDVEGFHIEVKRTERLSVYVAMAQANEDKRPKDIGMVMHRRSHKKWLVIMEADAFFQLLNEYVYEKEE